jgi:predicted DNA-binding antitoxin AbrB/MazE fold protein
MELMQSCKAYYDNGRFVPLGFGKLPEGTQAIITILDEVPLGVEERLNEYDALVGEIHAAADEEMPVLERIKFSEVRL